MRVALRDATYLRHVTLAIRISLGKYLIYQHPPTMDVFRVNGAVAARVLPYELLRERDYRPMPLLELGPRPYNWEESAVD